MTPSTRRDFLQTGAGAAFSAVGVASIASGAGAAVDARRQDSGIVWTQRYRAPETQYLFDVVRGPEDPYVFCGYTDDDGPDETLLRDTDRWGRVRSQRIGRELGGRGQTLVTTDDTLLMAGVDGDAPLLVGLESAFETNWHRTYDGTPIGPVRAASTGTDGHAIGWTAAADETGTVVVATDSEGAPRWSDELATDRTLASLLTTGGTASHLVAVGTQAGTEPGGGWVQSWQPDGTRELDRSIVIPGSGPAVAAPDGSGTVLAGTTDDGWWLQRRTGDWAVDWTKTVPAEGANPGVDDLAVLSDGLGLLAHDADGAVVVRTAADGSVQWRGRYKPYADADTDQPDRGHAMVPVENDEFVLAGVTATGQYGRDGWAARVGEPGRTTPAETPVPTPTETPVASPGTTQGDAQRTTRTGSPGTTRAVSPRSDTSGSPASDSPPKSPSATPNAEVTPGLGFGGAIAGLVGWLAWRRRIS